MGWSKDPEVRKAQRREEYKRGATAYIRRAKAYKKTPAGRKVDRNWRLKKLYGITGDAWEALYKQQEGRCALCGIEPIKHTDHSHITGKVRGLLCHWCNVGLGSFKDSVEILSRAILYLERHKQTQPKVS
jgi:hypothetical protein